MACQTFARCCLLTTFESAFPSSVSSSSSFVLGRPCRALQGLSPACPCVCVCVCASSCFQACFRPQTPARLLAGCCCCCCYRYCCCCCRCRCAWYRLARVRSQLLSMTLVLVRQRLKSWFAMHAFAGCCHRGTRCCCCRCRCCCRCFWYDLARPCDGLFVAPSLLVSAPFLFVDWLRWLVSEDGRVSHPAWQAPGESLRRRFCSLEPVNAMLVQQAPKPTKEPKAKRAKNGGLLRFLKRRGPCTRFGSLLCVVFGLDYSFVNVCCCWRLVGRSKCAG